MNAGLRVYNFPFSLISILPVFWNCFNVHSTDFESAKRILTWRWEVLNFI